MLKFSLPLIFELIHPTLILNFSNCKLNSSLRWSWELNGRDAAGLARYNYSEWKRLAADGVYVPPPTIYTKLIYPLQFIKYNFVAEVIRYAWYQVWVRLVVAYAPYHKKAVIEGTSSFFWLHKTYSPVWELHQFFLHSKTKVMFWQLRILHTQGMYNHVALEQCFIEAIHIFLEEEQTKMGC